MLVAAQSILNQELFFDEDSGRLLLLAVDQGGLVKAISRLESKKGP